MLSLALRSVVLEHRERAWSTHCRAIDLEAHKVSDELRPERVGQLYTAGVVRILCGDGQLTKRSLRQELDGVRADCSFMAVGNGQNGCMLEFNKDMYPSLGSGGMRFEP